MKKEVLFGVGTAACLAFTAVSAAAKDDDAEVPDYKLSEFNLGDHVSGEETDLSKLDGKVVAIEYWGTR